MSLEKKVKPVWLGLTPYDLALTQQQEAWTAARSGSEGFILGLEHPAVVTLGKRGNEQKDLRYDPDKSAVSVVHVDRGGQGTLHSPGQLVIYPIIPLSAWHIHVREFVELLQSAIQVWLKEKGVDAHRAPDEPGIYTSVGKIGFVGLRVERGITRHGIAINVYNDLSLFNLIRSCGKEVENFDSLKRYGINQELKSLFQEWCRCFAKTLGLTIGPFSA